MSQTSTDKKPGLLIVLISVFQDDVNSVPHSKAADIINKRKCFENGTSLTYLYFHCASFFFSPFLLPAADCCASNLCSRFGMFVSFSSISLSCFNPRCY